MRRQDTRGIHCLKILLMVSHRSFTLCISFCLLLLTALAVRCGQICHTQPLCALSHPLYLSSSYDPQLQYMFDHALVMLPCILIYMHNHVPPTNTPLVAHITGIPHCHLFQALQNHQSPCQPHAPTIMPFSIERGGKDTFRPLSVSFKT